MPISNENGWTVAGNVCGNQVFSSHVTKSLRKFSFPGELVVKNLPANVGNTKDVGLILWSGRSPRGGHGNPLQYSCLENPMYRGGWQAIAHGVAKNQTHLNTHTTVTVGLFSYLDSELRRKKEESQGLK